jgi:hypothetical protein
MSEAVMDRKQFVRAVGTCCAACCVGALVGRLDGAYAQDEANTAPQSTPPASPLSPPTPEKSRAQTRIEFADKWVVRFFGVLDGALDQATRRKLMMANGAACFRDYIKEIGRQPKRRTLEEFAAWVKDNVKDGSTQVEGNVITMQFTTAAETGQPSAEGACLCPLVESKPAGLSGTYCLCSLGYVKEWHESILGRPCEVELLGSVLTGAERCQFRVTVT